MNTVSSQPKLLRSLAQLSPSLFTINFTNEICEWLDKHLKQKIFRKYCKLSEYYHVILILFGVFINRFIGLRAIDNFCTQSKQSTHYKFETFATKFWQIFIGFSGDVKFEFMFESSLVKSNFCLKRYTNLNKKNGKVNSDFYHTLLHSPIEHK